MRSQPAHISRDHRVDELPGALPADEEGPQDAGLRAVRLDKAHSISAVIAVLALVWFLAELVRHLRRKGRGDGSAPAVIAGSVLVATLTVASAVRAAPVGDLVMDSEERAGNSGNLTPAFADFAQTASSLYDWLAFFGVGLAAATLVICVSLAARSTRALPRWLEWVGYAAAPVLAFVAFLNLIILMIWLIAVGIVIARAPQANA
jgi:hypothetical protein